MADEFDSFSGPQQTYDDFGNLGDDVTYPIRQVHEGTYPFFDGGDYTEEYSSQVRQKTNANNNYYYNEQQQQPHRRVANINIIVPDRDQINGPGPEYANDDEEIGADGVSKTKRFLRVFRKDLDENEQKDRDQRDELRAARKALRKEIQTTRRNRRVFYKKRMSHRRNWGVSEKATDINHQAADIHGDGERWKHRTEEVKRQRGEWLDPGTGKFKYGWVLPLRPDIPTTEAPISTISFSMAGVLPLDKPFMDRTAYYRVNHTLMQHTDEEIAQQKLDAMSFFEEQFGLTFKSDGKSIQGEEDDDSLEIPGLATLRHYAISPSLKTRITTAVSDNHPIEANEKVHEAGWVATVIAKRGANLGGIFGGDKGKAVKPGTSMSYGYWVFMNPEFQDDHAIIHFESSEPSFFGGASGHVAHHYVIHDLSVIDGIQIKKGAWGTATSMTTERKILGNKKKLGDLYGKTEARVQTTINVTHF